ncbi:DNA methyltransferase [Sinomonas soli]
MLTYTHQESIDVIYIDPPYNTGGKFAWLYNDDFVDTDDDYRHSKWLAFMERRLQLARELLKPSGAIMVSIGDDEQHRLRMLMEQIFGVENHVAQLAVEMSTTSGPKTTNAQQGTIVKNVEYVLIYRKSAAFDTEVRHTPLYDGIEKWDANYPLWLNDDGTTESLYQRLDEEPAVRKDIERLELIRAIGHPPGDIHRRPRHGPPPCSIGTCAQVHPSKPPSHRPNRHPASVGQDSRRARGTLGRTPDGRKDLSAHTVRQR